MKNQRIGVFPMYNVGIVAFFTVGVVFVIILVNIGFGINDAQKDVVEDAYDEVRDQLEVSGKISAATDVKSNEITITAIPVRVATGGVVNLNPQSAQISYNLVKQSTSIVNYENIYVDKLADTTFFSLKDAVEEAKNQGIIENNPLVDEQKPAKTTGFVYWVFNQNFDHFVDDGELAVITIIYSESDRPSTGDKVLIEVNVPEGFVLRIDEEVPSISDDILNFGGILN